MPSMSTTPDDLRRKEHVLISLQVHPTSRMDRARHCVKDQKHGPAIVRSVGDDGAVHRAAYWGGAARSETVSAAETFSRSAQAVHSTAPQGS
jgi:2-keto-3-deoxy-L-rhamnonate aldolase RhmA